MADAQGRFSGSADRVSFSSVTSTTDSRVFVGAPDYRVYLWGIDITADVISVSVEHGMNDQLTVARIAVVNDGEKWIVPPNVAATGQPFASDNLNEVTTGPNPQETNFLTKFMDQKRQNFIKRGSFYLSGFNNFVESLAHGPTYPMVPGMSAIQSTDPIRVFLRNPWIVESNTFNNTPPTISELVGPSLDGVDTERNATLFPNEEWYFAFTGFVATVSEQYDASTDRSILTLYCEEIRRLLRYMQTTTNPQIIDQATVENAAELENNPARVSQDIGTSTQYARVENMTASVISGQTVVQALETMLFGETDSNKKDKIVGVHGFDSTREVRMEAPKGQVEQQTSLQLEEMYPRLSLEQVDSFGKDFAFENLTLYILLPDPAGFPNRSWPYSFQVNATQFSEFRNRFDILDEFITSIDTLWYSTPKGDIVLEFPQYDMLPFNHTEPWRNILQIQNEWSGFTLSDDDRAVKTLALAKASAIKDQDVKSIIFDAAVISDQGLQARYGLRILPVDKPFYFGPNDQPGGLKALTAMRLHLANADSNRLEGLECLPSFRAPIARPYWFKYRNIIGFCTGITHRVIWNQAVQTIYTLEHLRTYDSARRDWVRLSDGYGWSWDRPTQIDTPKSGTPDVTNPPPPEAQNTQMSTEISSLADDQRAEATSILSKLYNEQLPPDQVQQLQNRLTQLIGNPGAID